MDDETALRLASPEAVFPDDFGLVQTIVERPDGSVLVADPLGRRLYLVDMDAGTRTVVGSEGSGPGEYLQPDAVWPLSGDSTLLVDLGNSRLVVLGPDLEFGSTMPIMVGDPGSSDGMALAMPRGVDGLGRVYAESRGGLGQEAPDSGAILRIDRGTQRIDTAGTFELMDVVRTVGPGGRGVTVRPIPLSPEDAWGVGPDGSVAVARAGRYQLDWIGSDGTVRSGAPVPVAPIPVGSTEQNRWLADQGRMAGFFISVTRGTRGTEVSMERGSGDMGLPEPDPDDFEWAETLPAVRVGRVPIDPAGRAWVHRYTPVGDPPTYDVFDRSGERITTVELEPDRIIVGFGGDAVYVVRYDEFNLNYLERYAMPAL